MTASDEDRAHATNNLRARNAQTRLNAPAWAYATPYVPHALQPARAAPGTRLALHQRLTCAPAEIIFGRSNNGAPARARRMHAGETASPMSAAYATCDTHVSAAARRPQRACLRSPTTPARTTHTQARRLHTRTNGQRTRRTRLLADAARNIYCATFIRWNDGCRWNALHSLPPPSLDTHGPRVRVALR